jgi:LysM repeat protein
MKQKDADRMDTFNSDPQENNYNEQYSIWKKDKKAKFGANIPKLSEKNPLARFGMGFLILIILLILLFARNRSAELENRIGVLENRVKNFEETVFNMETVDEKVAQIWEQAQTVEQFKERFDRSEAALTSRMNQIVKNFDRLQKQMAELRIQKAKSSETAKVSKKTDGNRYHIVKPGETLYKIGRQYGLTVKKMRLLNKLGDGDAIYPGQSLLISP